MLRHSVTLKDAITQSGNIAGLMIGLLKPDYHLISRSLKDVIAEPMRSVFIPGFNNLRQIAMEAGALGFGISGSGPTVFALSQSETKAQQVAEAIQVEFLRHKLNTDPYVSKVNQEGAKVLTVD